MGFTTGAKITADILDEIVNGFIATNLWHNVDTTWNTLNRTGNNARVALCYGPIGAIGKGNTTLSLDLLSGTKVATVTDVANFSVGDKVAIGPSDTTSEVRIVVAINIMASTVTLDANVNITHYATERFANVDIEIYMAIEVINSPQGYYYGGQGWWYNGKGFRIIFSASWDAVAHTYPTSNQSTFLPIESQRDTVYADLATMVVTYWLWIENNGNGFVIMGKPEPTADSNQQSFIWCIGRNPAKEYTDGYTNFYCFVSGNIWQNCLYDGNWPLSIWRNRTLLRPFAYQYPDHTGYTSYGVNGNGLSFVPTPSYYAFKSNGNNKVYYVKPIIHNVAGQNAPVFQSDLFFLWSEGVGLIDGDVISIEGRTTKYLCKGLDSPDSTNRITFAIKYVE